ncbi:MAG: hypothetical protein GC157_09050 [Frankiales bacterium]|nr:hypothetical protein [Frankiales bacterium]
MTGAGRGVLRRVRGSQAADAGAVAIIVALMTPVLLGFCALAVDIARWYVEAERVQKVADAAALAGVVYLPQDFAKGKATALSVAASNGYAPSATVSVDVRVGARPSQLEVTVASTVTNAFGQLLGFPTTTIARTAVSDYNGPAPMGSPCWAFGNEPDPLGQSRPSNCPQNPNFWATIHGPEVDKTQGDQFSTRYCAGGESGCSGSTNTEFDPNGYIWAIHVADVSRVSSVQVQLFDASYVKTGFYCDDRNLPAANAYRPNGTAENPYVSDARTRYAPGTQTRPTAYCPGDGDYASNRTTPTTTTFVLRSPVSTQNPLQAPVIGTCERQFFGWNDPASLSTVLDSRRTPAATSITDRNHYQPQLAETFHRWTTLCTIPGPLQQGDYYLQVRTDVPYGAPTSAWSAPGDNSSEHGQGANRFSIRAIVSGDPNAVSIGSLQHMPIFANDPNNSTATFNLIRVLPGAAGKVIKFTFFDVGDAAGNGTASVAVKAPLEATGSNINSASDTISTCSGVDWNNSAQTLSGCVRGGITSSTWNGKSYTIYVPIPNDYTCNYGSLSGCWYRVQVGFPTGTLLTDATTWSASITGDPVRLVK